MLLAIYLCGIFFLVAGWIVGATLLNVPIQWIALGATSVIGFFVITGVKLKPQEDSVE